MLPFVGGIIRVCTSRYLQTNAETESHRDTWTTAHANADAHEHTCAHAHDGPYTLKSLDITHTRLILKRYTPLEINIGTPPEHAHTFLWDGNTQEEADMCTSRSTKRNTFLIFPTAPSWSFQEGLLLLPYSSFTFLRHAHAHAHSRTGARTRALACAP